MREPPARDIIKHWSFRISLIWGVVTSTVDPRDSGLQNSGLPLSSGQFLGDQLFYIVIPLQ